MHSYYSNSACSELQEKENDLMDILSKMLELEKEKHRVSPIKITVWLYALVLLELGVFFVALNCICLSFVQIHALFYFNYIIYYGLLIFCCQNVATLLFSCFYCIIKTDNWCFSIRQVILWKTLKNVPVVISVCWLC